MGLQRLDQGKGWAAGEQVSELWAGGSVQPVGRVWLGSGHSRWLKKAVRARWPVLHSALYAGEAVSWADRLVFGMLGTVIEQ